jgi:hypothetical protein
MAMAKKNTGISERDKLKAENARLMAENGRLERLVTMQQNSKSGHSLTPKQILRRAGVFALVSLAIALLVVGNLLFWLGNTIVKPDRFNAATTPIIKDTKVQQAMAAYTTNNIFQNVDVQKITEQALPPRADFLAPQLTAQLKSTTEKTLQAALAKPTFQEKWNNILATQHERLVNFAGKYNGDGAISINDVYNQMEASLQNSKLSFLANKKLPPKVGSITVVNAGWLPAFHNVVAHIDTWRLLSVTAFAVCAAAAVWLSRNRRKTLYTLSFAASGFMLISLLAFRMAREVIVQKVDPAYAEGVRSATQIFFHPLVLQTATILFAFVLLAFVAWVSSPSRSAAALREKVGLVLSGKLHSRLFGDDSTGVVAWVGKNKHLLEWSVVAIIAALMLLVRLTLKSLILYALLMLVSVMAIEVVAGRPGISTYKFKEH